MKQIFDILKKSGLSRQSKTITFRSPNAYNNFFVVASASMIVGVAAQMLIAANFGVGAYDAFVLGIIETTGIPFFSLAAWTASGTIFVLAFILGEKPSFYNALTLVIIGISVDISSLFIPTSNMLNAQIASWITGMVLLAFGISIFTHTKSGGGAIEMFVNGLKNKTGLSIVKGRWILDAFLLFSAYMLSGKIGVGTLLQFLLLPPMIGYMSQQMSYLSVGKFFVQITEKDLDNLDEISVQKIKEALR